VIERCKFLCNKAATTAVAASIATGSSTTVRDCLFYGNTALFGAAVAVYDSNAVIANNTVVRNGAKHRPSRQRQTRWR